MLCVECLKKTEVKDSRPKYWLRPGGGYEVIVYRKHICKKCNKIFRTIEKVIQEKDTKIQP